MRAVDDEERDGVDAEAGGGALVLADLGGEAVAGEQVADLVGRQPGLDRQALERGRVADRLALGEVARA